MLASLLAGSAFLATTWLDSKLSSHPYNDVKLTGQIFTTKSPAWQIIGLTNHFSFALVMTGIYASLVYPRLPGPGWLKGLLFLQVENLILYPGAAVLEQHHAGVQSGQLPTLFSWKSWWGQVLRHVVFGTVLGLVYSPAKKS